MQPTEGPTNDNRQEPAPKWEDTPLGKRVMLCVSLVVIVVIYAGGYLYLSPEKWQGMWITIGIAFVGMLIAGIYRLIVHGRA